MADEPTTRDIMDALLDFRDAVGERFDRVEGTLAVHGRILEDHTRILEDHSRILDDHSRRLDSIDRRLLRIEDRVEVLERR